MEEIITFIAGQKITLINGRTKIKMTVLGQVKDYVALCDDNSIEVFTTYEDKGKQYLLTNNDGGPNWCYKFKVE